MEPESDKSAIFEFGRFKVVPLRREILVDGASVEIGGRAFDLLMALIGARGSILSKEELIARAWPGRVVEDNNLQVQIAALRRIFTGEHEFIRTVSGRGYQFTGEIRAGSEPAAAQPALTNVSRPVTELIGRDVELEQVLRLAAEHRFVTLTGEGGIGKTRLGLEAARHLLPRFPDGVWLAELGPLANPEVVPVTVASALGLSLSVGSIAPEHVATALGAKRLLLVLDNCEHVIEAAARMVEVLLRSTPSVSVLATSREPLRVPNEYVYRVPPLEVPAEDALGREDLLKTGAVKLYMARARDSEPQFSPDKRVAAIAAICRQLDGIPLAIELAAARTSALGVEGLAARLDDRFKLLTGGRRTGLARHQTLRATLDWSYELLPAFERVVLRRMAVFAGSFTLDAVSAVASGGAIAEADVFDYVANLVTKSLVATDSGPAMRYRLLETNRAYALEKLNESGEFAEFARRHAEYHRDLFEKAEAEWETARTADWLAAYGRQIDNLRAALDWAFLPGGDVEVGIALTVAAVPLWMHLSLIVECRTRVEQALAHARSDSPAGMRREMRLHAALAWSLMYTAGPVRETGTAWTNAIEMSERLNDAEYQMRALWGLWIYHLSSGESRATLALAKRFGSLAASQASPSEVLVGERMVGVSLHYLGDQIGARTHLERVLDNYVAPAERSHAIRFQYDQRVSAQATLVRVLWLQGLSDQAAQTARTAIDDARRLDHALSLALALEAACLLDLFVGDLDAAERSMTLLLDHARRHAIGRWHAWGHCFEGVLRARRGDVEGGLQRLRAGLDDLRRTRFALFYIKFLGDFAQAFGDAMQVAQGLEAVDEALARSERNDERWCFAELLRIKGELMLKAGAPDAAAQAERCFVEALDWARRQGALAWELRAAMSLGRLRHASSQTENARELLASVYGKFTEGLDTADLKAAWLLLDTLR